MKRIIGIYIAFDGGICIFHNRLIAAIPETAFPSIKLIKPRQQTTNMELGDLCMDYAEYRFTNESLEAVMAGLQVSEGDRIFAVCGAGDQAFAMVEKADYVLAFDRLKLQADYARRTMNLIKDNINDVRKALESRMDRASTFYFLKRKRLEK